MEDYQNRFYEDFQLVLSNIESYRVNSLMDDFTDWLLYTEANPYSFLPEGYEESLFNPYDTLSLLRQIHHAVYDDGEITFLTVNGQPRIEFANKHETDFNRMFEKHTTRAIGYTRKAEIEILDIEINDFPQICEDNHSENIKGCFMLDANQFGIESAIGHYSNYKVFDRDWIAEAKTKFSPY